jgi:uncharacterized protein YjbJ (UPF0337 family)
MPGLVRYTPQLPSAYWIATRSHIPRRGNFLTEVRMNSNQVKGAMKDVAGKAQEKFGKAVGSTDHQVKGLAKQGEGKVQKKVGDAQEAVKDAQRDARRAERNEQHH